jgi:hypothetical protein
MRTEIAGRLKALLLCLSAALVLAAFWLGEAVYFSEQWPLYEALRTTASIIFAVVGAWLAIVFPERLKGIRGQDDDSAAYSGGMRVLFTPIVHSSIILCVVLMVGVLAPMLKQVDWSVSQILILRKLSFALLMTLTIWQVWTVLLTLDPASRLKSQAQSDEAASAHMSALDGNSSPPDD